MKVGLTGGLASGKSTVAARWRDAGLVVVDADKIVADLYRAGRPGARVVEELFGEVYLTPRGAVDHERLARLVFADADALEKLESRIHPLVLEEFVTRTASATGPVVIEGTLLVEAGYASDLDLLVTVEADSERRLEWAIARGLSREQAVARLAAQGDGDLRRRAADRIITNEGSLGDLLAEADRMASDILDLAAREDA